MITYGSVHKPTVSERFLFAVTGAETVETEPRVLGGATLALYRLTPLYPEVCDVSNPEWRRAPLTVCGGTHQ